MNKINLLTPLDVDDLLGYPYGQSQRMAKKGKLTHVLLPCGAIRFRPADIEQVINKGLMVVEPGADNGKAETYAKAVSQYMALGKTECESYRQAARKFPEAHENWKKTLRQ